MDVFALRDRLVEDYASYARSFSLEPAVHDGDRLLAAIARKPPATARWLSPGTAAGSWSSAPNILPRTDPVPGGLVSANPACEPCTPLADEHASQEP